MHLQHVDLTWDVAEHALHRRQYVTERVPTPFAVCLQYRGDSSIGIKNVDRHGADARASRRVRVQLAVATGR
ncbi:hypothetical protein GCM10028793_06210 [Nocardiopsis oceani]